MGSEEIHLRLARQLRHCGALVSAPHSSVFARLASGAFYETILPATFCEIIMNCQFILSF